MLNMNLKIGLVVNELAIYPQIVLYEMQKKKTTLV